MDEKKKAPANADKGTQEPAKKQTDNNTERKNISFKEEPETALDRIKNYVLNGGNNFTEYENLYEALSDEEKKEFNSSELSTAIFNDFVEASKGINALLEKTKLLFYPKDKRYLTLNDNMKRIAESLNTTLKEIEKIKEKTYQNTEYRDKLNSLFLSVSEVTEPAKKWQIEQKETLPYLKKELKKKEYNGATPEDVLICFNLVGSFLPDVLGEAEKKQTGKNHKITPQLARQAWENAKKAKEKADREKLQKKYNSTAETYTGPYLATYHSQVTDNFLLLEKKNAQQTTQQEIADKAIIQTPAGDYRMEISNFSKIKGLSINTHKLFSMGLAGLTAQNNYTHSGKTGGLNLRVNIPLNLYMNRVYPSTIFNKDAADLDKEKNRVENAVKKARRNIRADINFWRDSRIEWEETIKGKPYKSSGFINILGAGKINKDYIQLEFTQSIAEYLLQLPINQYATWLLSIDSKKPNAYRIGLKLVQHANMDNNIIKGTADRLRVTTILKTTKLPSYEDLQNENEDNSRKWESRIKEPLENALDELQAAGGVSDWQYVKPGGIPLTDEEAESITDYETWANLLIEFSLSNQPDHTERLNRRKEEKAKAAKKTKKAKKKDV